MTFDQLVAQGERLLDMLREDPTAGPQADV